MTVTYWSNFSKRKNSTKQATTGTDVTVRLKEECSIINPVFESATMPATANYIYVSEWGRYYFVTNVTYISNTTKLFSCEVDVLASFKTQIGSTVAHIAYSSTGYDKYIIDSRLAVEDVIETDHDAAASGLSSTGCYMLSIITDTSNGSQGAAAFYHLEDAYLRNLTRNLFDTSVTNIIAQAFYDPFMTIIKSYWIPLDAATVDANCDGNDLITLTNSPISTTALPVYGKQVNTALITLPAVSIDIPNRQQDFRDSQPFTTLTLYLPGVGLTDLNANDFSDSAKVNIYTRIDITTGDIIYWIYTDSGDVVKTVSFNGAVDIPLAHVSANSGGALSSIGGAITTGATYMLTGNTTALTLGALASATGAATSFNQRSTSLKGNIQGKSAFADVTFSLGVAQLKTADPDDASYIATWGRPVGVTHAISNHSGFVQCDNASVGNIGTPIEKDRVNQYLNSGFFYE